MSASGETINSPRPAREAFRDELNFAEFPLASLSTSLPQDQKTLEFTDEIFDKAANQRITRKLTITASDKFGLPTATDDEVILGLIQLTGKTEFSSKRVYFTRYELLKLLDWPDSSRNYHRLEQSLNRWLGVTLYYDKAWWSKEEQSWVSEGFHILEHVQILDQERQRRSSKKPAEQAGKSSFVWNEVVFNSFKSGYIKQLDFAFYKNLKSAISKRLYRFLDKRFYRGQRLEFDLRVFACEHIGLSKNYHTGELKRVLAPAIRELEEQGFLAPMPAEERFIRKARGEWNIVVSKARGNLPATSCQSSPFIQALVDRGISAGSARVLAGKFSAERLQEKITLFDWLASRNDPRVQRNRAGFLYRSITEDFPMPEDFRAILASNAKAKERRPSSRKPPEPQRVLPERSDVSAPSDRSAIDAAWNSIPLDDRVRIEHQLVKETSPFLRDQYVTGQKERGVLFNVIRQTIIDEYVRKLLAASKPGSAAVNG